MTCMYLPPHVTLALLQGKYHELEGKYHERVKVEAAAAEAEKDAQVQALKTDKAQLALHVSSSSGMYSPPHMTCNPPPPPQVQALKADKAQLTLLKDNLEMLLSKVEQARKDEVRHILIYYIILYYTCIYIGPQDLGKLRANRCVCERERERERERECRPTRA
jgi:hypothetical protein